MTKLQQHDINSVHSWCLVNGMKINLDKTTIISFSRKTNSIYFNYKLCNNLVTCCQCVKALSVLLDCKLYFHQHIDCILSQGLKMLGLIRYITSSFSTPEALWFCIVHLFGLNLSMHWSFGILSLLLILPNLKESKENLQHYVTPDSSVMQVHINTKTF
jgi:hypothetical protein